MREDAATARCFSAAMLTSWPRESSTIDAACAPRGGSARSAASTSTSVAASTVRANAAQRRARRRRASRQPAPRAQPTPRGEPRLRRAHARRERRAVPGRAADPPRIACTSSATASANPARTRAAAPNTASTLAPSPASRRRRRRARPRLQRAARASTTRGPDRPKRAAGISASRIARADQHRHAAEHVADADRERRRRPRHARRRAHATPAPARARPRSPRAAARRPMRRATAAAVARRARARSRRRASRRGARRRCRAGNARPARRPANTRPPIATVAQTTPSSSCAAMPKRARCGARRVRVVRRRTCRRPRARAARRVRRRSCVPVRRRLRGPCEIITPEPTTGFDGRQSLHAVRAAFPRRAIAALRHRAGRPGRQLRRARRGCRRASPMRWSPRDACPATASPCRPTSTGRCCALYLATLRAGLVYLPLNTGYQRAELEYFFGDAEPRVDRVPRRDAGRRRDARRRRDGADARRERRRAARSRGGACRDTFATVARAPDDLAAILYTSRHDRPRPRARC